MPFLGPLVPGLIGRENPFFELPSQDVLDDPPFMVLFQAASLERRLFLSKNIHEWREKISPPPPPVQATIPLVLAVCR